jgi:hypothetical protein
MSGYPLTRGEPTSKHASSRRARRGAAVEDCARLAKRDPLGHMQEHAQVVPPTASKQSARR